MTLHSRPFGINAIGTSHYSFSGNDSNRHERAEFIVGIFLWITMATSIQIRPEMKARPDVLKLHPQESYDEMLNRLFDMTYNPEPLSEEMLQQITEDIRDIRVGRYRSLTDIAEESGLE